jgi:hypothetical protein
MSSAPHSRDSSSPLKPIMQRCVFLRFRFVHRTRPPRVETRPKQQVYAPPFHWAERNPNSARHDHPGNIDNPIRRKPAFDSADHLAKRQGSKEPQLAKTRPSQRPEQSLEANLQSPNQVSMSSDNSSFNFHPRHFGDSGITTNGERTANLDASLNLTLRQCGTTPREL